MRFAVIIALIGLLASCGIFRNQKKETDRSEVETWEKLDVLRVDTGVRLVLEQNLPVVIPSRTYGVSVPWDGLSLNETNQFYKLVLKLDSGGKRLSGQLVLPDTIVNTGGNKLLYERNGLTERDKSKSGTSQDDKRVEDDNSVSWRTVVMILGIVILVLIFLYIKWPKK